MRAMPFVFHLVVALFSSASVDSPLPFIRVADDHRSFLLDGTTKRFTPWGFNYDHDDKGMLLEDYWETDWSRVAEDFQEMKDLGANVVRIHLQFGKFMDAADRPNEQSLTRLDKLVKLAEKTQLYLDLTGLGCYHKKDVPPWYDALSESDRWEAQANFWRAIAKRCKDSPAIFCYDLMNEPVVPGGKRKPGDWLGPPFAGSHFVQVISLDQGNRPRPDIGRAWIKKLVGAIREQDRRHLITVGLVDWSLDRPGLTSGFVPEKIAVDLDFLSVHLYPKAKKVDEALETLKGFAVGKPVVIEETFPLQCSMEEFSRFIEGSERTATGWIGFYWGKTPAELRRGKTIGDAMTLHWLEFFEKKAKKFRSP
jgi:cellulase (glycosyl hydrolase family 5)